MSASIVAALKRLALAAVTDKRILKTVCGVVLGIIILIIMPVFAFVGVLSGNIHFDTDGAHLDEALEDEMSDELLEKLSMTDSILLQIHTEMENAGFGERIDEAMVLCITSLKDKAYESDFVNALVGCFEEEQNRYELVSNVNDTFGTDIDPDEFIKMMEEVESGMLHN